eukprot:TRINITY_DN3581_c0_g2_i3.p1 TRINITY_DN3581_c0_g2~~TRINITY_DN3581_c0_g2_i3.p1  ORF type:complete len:379 (-),score=20.26 TRINITY_DN3581_c0_g2_i3:431-1471(-)
MVLGFGRKRRRSELVVVASATSTALSTAVDPGVQQFTTKPISDVIAGLLARTASQSTIHPIDTFKVRIQHKSAGGVVNVASSALSKKRTALLLRSPSRLINRVNSSVRSLYKGVVGASSGAGIAVGAYFAFYSVACNFLHRETSLPPGGVAFFGGAIAAAGSSIVKVPIAVCIRSVQAGVYSNVFSAGNQIYKSAGLRGLFTGYWPTVLEDVPDMAFKFAAYESLRAVHKIFYQGRHPSAHEDFIYGAIAGAFAAAVTTPLDAIKTGMMTSAASRPSMFQISQKIFHNGGWRAFFNGLGPRAISNGINSAVFFCFFESFRSFIVAHQQKQSRLFEQNQQSLQLQLQ